MNNFVLLFVIALCGTSSSLNVERTDRIIGGLPAEDNQFPYMISLQQLSQVTNYTRGHRCGGALVTLRHAVTSASCLYNSVNGVHTLIAPNEYRVFAGAAVLTNDDSADRHRTVESFTVHPDYKPDTPYVNDIAVITLTTGFPRNTVSTLPLPTSNIVIGPVCTSSGWGAQNNTNSPSTQLMHLSKLTMDQIPCQRHYAGQSATGGTELEIQPTMICAIATRMSSSCSGDSGNPLVCDNNLSGILVVNDCLITNTPRPEVYTRVSRFATWINLTAGASTFQPGMAVIAVIAIVQIITANVLN